MQNLFDARFPGKNGAAVLFDGQKATLYHDTDAQRRFTPCSTFKLYLALFGLETGVVRSASELWKYNGERVGQAEGRKDMDLGVALLESSEWYFREVARKIGAKRLRDLVARINYGSGWKGAKPEDAYIDGSMLISPLEQAQLAWKLETESLPFAKEHQRIVKNNLKVAGLSLWGKTGSGRKYPDGLALGWYVGAYRNSGKSVALAVLERAPDTMGPKVRTELIRRLKRSGS
jgi:beta-lactamase class D